MDYVRGSSTQNSIALKPNCQGPISSEIAPPSCNSEMFEQVDQLNKQIDVLEGNIDRVIVKISPILYAQTPIAPCKDGAKEAQTDLGRLICVYTNRLLNLNSLLELTINRIAL